MPLDQVIASATVNAARVFPAFDDCGILNIGAPPTCQYRRGSGSAAQRLRAGMVIEALGRDRPRELPHRDSVIEHGYEL
jgi:hypothetical protein